MLNLNQLRVFCEAAKHESFTGAAQRLFITQPAVTAQVRSFEEHCSFKLFKKKGRKLYLTDAGKTIYEYAKRIYEYEKDVEGVIEELRELKRGALHLGTTKTYARYFMPFLITSFRETYPHIKVQLNEGSSLDMIHSLIDLKNEVAVIAKVEDNPNVTFIPFSQEELVLITAPNHPLAQKKSASVGELVDEPMIMKEVGSGTRKRVSELFHQRGLTPRVLMETSNTEFIKQLVQRGEGISFVVQEAVAAEIGEKKLASPTVEGKRIFLDVSIAYLKDQHLSHPAKAFLDILRKMAGRERCHQGIRAVMEAYLDKWGQGPAPFRKPDSSPVG